MIEYNLLCEGGDNEAVTRLFKRLKDETLTMTSISVVDIVIELQNDNFTKKCLSWEQGIVCSEDDTQSVGEFKNLCTLNAPNCIQMKFQLNAPNRSLDCANEIIELIESLIRQMYVPSTGSRFHFSGENKLGKYFAELFWSEQGEVRLVGIKQKLSSVVEETDKVMTLTHRTGW
jgi:hypothetical protein